MKKLTAFIVDDKRLIRESLARTVRWEECGFIVAGEAGDGLAAEEAIRRLRPDLVVTDIRMPGRDGLSLAERVRDFLPRTKVIIITGHEEFEYAQRSLRAGAVDIILKPIRNEDLEKALRKAATLIGRTSERPPATENLPDAVENGRSPGALIRSILLYIEENIAADVRLSTLAEIYRVTPSHLSRTFKRETGVKYHRYVTERRIAMARRLLSDPGWRISEISGKCGFPSPVRFTRIFKDATGLTPSEYRRQQGRSKVKKRP